MTGIRRKGFLAILTLAWVVAAGPLRAQTRSSTTAPATAPSTAPAPGTQPATTTAASSKPTTLPALPTTLPTTSPAAPQAVPIAGEQAEAERLVHNTFADAYKDAAAARGALAAALLHRAQARFDPPAVRYVLLRESRDVAADAGHATGAVAAVNEMARQFRIDAREMRVETLERTASRATADADYAALASAGMSMVADAMGGSAGPDDFAAAARLGMATVTWAAASHDGTLALRARAWNSDVQAIATEAARVQPAFEKLKAHLEDAEANLAVGRLRALYLNDWAQGLPLLAKGSDATLAALAKLELAQPKKQSEQLKLADAWWAQSQAATGLPKSRLLQRACLWYGRLYPNVVGPTRNHVERRLTEAGYTPDDLEELK